MNHKVANLNKSLCVLQVEDKKESHNDFLRCALVLSKILDEAGPPLHSRPWPH